MRRLILFLFLALCSTILARVIFELAPFPVIVWQGGRNIWNPNETCLYVFRLIGIILIIYALYDQDKQFKKRQGMIDYFSK